jgi:ribosomal protein S27E
MSQKEIIIALSELGRLEVICPNCKGSATAVSADGPFPTKCGACGEVLASGISNIGAAWKEFVRQANGAVIQFRIKQ